VLNDGVIKTLPLPCCPLIIADSDNIMAVGKHYEVYWEQDEMWYHCIITDYDTTDTIPKLVCVYDDLTTDYSFNTIHDPLVSSSRSSSSSSSSSRHV